MIVCQQQTNEDKTTGKPANDHFHNYLNFLSLSLGLVETTRHQCSDDHAVDSAEIRIARQRTSPGRAADGFVRGEAKPAADNCANDNPHTHRYLPPSWSP